MAPMKSAPVDWGAGLAEIVGGNTVLEYAANRDIFSRQTEVVMARNKSQPVVAMAKQSTRLVDWAAFLAGISRGKMVLEYGANRSIFVQGDDADAVWYLQQGKVKLAVTSQQGKEAIVAVLGAGEFFGEGCLAGRPVRIATASTLSECTLYRVEKLLMMRMLHEQHGISELFVTHLLSRNMRYQEDLVDQLFNSSEKRLARILLLLTHFGKEAKAETVLPGIKQEHLAQMVGTTRSRVSHFMNKFRTLGFVNYTGNGPLTVHSGLLTVVLHD